MKIKFCGAAKTVTGSCHLLEFEGGRVVVDCGMRQGEDAKNTYGEGDFAFNPGEVTALLLTHAHIDHTGLVPLLVKRGFKGPIITTDATAKLCTIMLPDSAHIQEQDAEWQTRKNERANKPPVEPLYDSQDVEAALKLFRPTSYDKIVEVCPGVKARFTDVGHLLGSAAIEIWVTEGKKTTRVVFSGDLGRADRPIIEDPDVVEAADYLILESTYGDRNHALSTDAQKEEQLATILKMALARGGNIVIPAFAVGRTQELLFYIKRMLLRNTVPGLERVPVYIDSPLGINATRVYESCAEGYYDAETREMAKGGSPFEFPTLRVAETADESKAINTMKGSNIIISASGMCDAGRIRHHLKHNLYRADSTILFVGYQAAGTLGRVITDGAKDVKLFGEPVHVNATIEQIDGFSGHAGKNELVAWLQGIKQKPAEVFLVHGEPEAITSLETAITSLGYRVAVPEPFEEFELSESSTAAAAPKGAKLTKGVERLPRLANQEAHAAGKAAASVQEPAAPSAFAPAAADREVRRIAALLEQAAGDQTAEGKFKLKLLRADLRALASKWEEFFE